jgi:hypothetical protein
MNAVDILERQGPVLAQISFGGGDLKGDIEATVLKQTKDRLVLHFTSGGTGYVLKQFDSDSVKGAQCYQRERDGLNLLGQSGLTAKMTHFNDAELFVIQDYIPGPSLAEDSDADTVLQTCETLGKWLADYETYAPMVPMAGNWFDHLSRLRSDADLQPFEGFLRNFPLSHTSLQRGDGVLSNFVRHENGKIIGFDFEKSNWLPQGWDFLLTARAAMRKHPQQTQEAIAALAKGYCRGKKQAAKRWAALATIFVGSYGFVSHDEGIQQ